MVIKGIEEDYAMDKARVDAEGFDALQSMQDICSFGHVIEDGEEVTTILGIKFCSKCNLESEASND